MNRYFSRKNKEEEQNYAIKEEMDIINELVTSDGERFCSWIDLDEPIASYSLSKPVLVNVDDKLTEVIQRMNTQKVDAVLVTNDNNVMVGIFTYQDVVKRLFQPKANINDDLVSDYMTMNPLCLDYNDKVSFALNRFVEGNYHHIPIIRDDEIKYLFTVDSFINTIATRCSKSILNLPLDPENAPRNDMKGG